jgi:general stress protein 26
METGSREKLMDILKTFRNAMLVTQANDGALRSRPMALLKIEENGDLWFISGYHSAKVDEIAMHAQVNVSLQKERAFLSLSGRAAISRDRAKIDELWTEECKVYFPKGKDDPNIALIKVSPSEGEYWDNEGLNGLKFLLESVKAYITGTTPNVDHDQHGAVQMQGGAPVNGGARAPQPAR